MGYMDCNNRLTWSSQSADDTSATGDHADVFAPGQRVNVHAVGAIVSTVASGAATVQFDKTSGGTRGAADAGVVTIPDTTAVNQVIRDTTDTIFPFVLEVGEFITPEVSTAATSGGAHYFIEYEPIQDTDANEANVTESA